MAYELTDRLKGLSQESQIEPNIILTIEGYSQIFSTVPLVEFWTIGSGKLIGDAGLEIGGATQDPNNLTLISKQGTTNQISQQIEIEKGGSGSIQKFRIQLVDRDEILMQIFSPGQVTADLLGKEANVFLNLNGGVHPDDSIRIFSGIIDGQDVGPGNWRLSIAHPEILKNQDILVQAQTELVVAIDDTQIMDIELLDPTGFISGADALISFVQIDDEIIQFTGIDGSNKLVGAVRAALGTTAESHDADNEITSFYQLTGKPLDLARKILLSNDGNAPYVEDVSVPNFVQVTASDNIANSIIVQDQRFFDDQGLVPGALVTITGATNGANNVVDAPIINIITQSDGTILVLDGVALVSEVGSAAIMSIKSQYNTLPTGAGAGMNPRQVDLEQFASLDVLLGSADPTISPYIKDTINAKSFLASELFFPYSYYQSPRKGRSSLVGILPPLVLEKLPRLDQTNILNPGALRMQRQITKDFFNSVVYRFDQDALTDKFLSGEVIISESSQARIPTKNTSLTVDAPGLRDSLATRDYIQKAARRLSDRYRFAAETVNVITNFSVGFNIEVGDSVLLDGSLLGLGDIKNATRSFQPRLFTVVNKKTSLVNGQMQLKLLDTQVGLDARFGVISPASYIDVGSSTTSLKLKDSFNQPIGSVEQEKYTDYINETLIVHNADYSFSETVTLTSLDAGDITRININPPLSMVPPEDYVVELGDYPNTTDILDNNDAKAIHCFWDPTVPVVAGISSTVIEVAPGDINKFFIDSFVRVHSDDYTSDSTPGQNDDNPQVILVDTILNRITVGLDLGFTPSVGDKIELIGFPDQGLPYRFF